MNKILSVIFTSIGVVALCLFLYGWFHVTEVQRAANNTYMSRNEVYVYFSKCRNHHMRPVAKPDINMFGFMNEKVQKVYCFNINRFNEIKVYDAIDGKPYRFDRDQIVTAAENGETWKEKYGEYVIPSSEYSRENIAGQIEDFYDGFDQQRIDEMKVKAGELEASAPEAQ